MNQEIQELFQNQSVFQEFAPEELAVLENHIELQEVGDGATIINEGDRSSEMYFILEGKINLFKKDEATGTPFQIGSLEKGDVFGEMSFLEGAPRSSSGIADGKVRLAALAKRTIDTFHPDPKGVVGKMAAQIAGLQMNRLKTSNVGLAESLRKEKEALEQSLQSANFFLLMILTFGLVSFMNRAIQDFDVPVFTTIGSWLYLLLLVTPPLVFIRRFRLPMSDFGITRVRWKVSTLKGIVFCGSAMGLYLGYVWLNREIIATKFPALHVEWLDFKWEKFFSWWNLLYVFHSTIQEFVNRGILQTSLMRFLNDSKGYKSVVITAAVFGSFHIHFGFVMVLITFVSGIFFGWYYLKDRNLIGVSMVHWVPGAILFCSGIPMGGVS